MGLQKRLVDEGKLPWVQCVVSRGGHIVYNHCVGAPSDTIHRLYSCSKVVTCVALMMLCEEGRLLLRLDDALLRRDDGLGVGGRTLARAQDLSFHTLGLKVSMKPET